jgi:hypothetical protein
MMAINISEKHVYSPAMEYVKQWIRSQSNEQRRAAIIALAVMAEGCNESMLQDLPSLLQCVRI